MTDHARWEQLATYATGFEAEDIPVLIKGPQVGVFGAGFQGVMGGGLALFVPSPEIDRARELLAD